MWREKLGVQAHPLCLEVEGRWRGREPGAGGEAVVWREREAAKAGGGSEFGQRSPAVGDPKKRLELVALKFVVFLRERKQGAGQAEGTGNLKSLRSDKAVSNSLVSLRT